MITGAKFLQNSYTKQH